MNLKKAKKLRKLAKKVCAESGGNHETSYVAKKAPFQNPMGGLKLYQILEPGCERALYKEFKNLRK